MFKLKFDEINEETLKVAQLTIDELIHNSTDGSEAELVKFLSIITISFNCGEYYFSGNIETARHWINILKDVVKLPKK